MKNEKGETNEEDSAKRFCMRYLVVSWGAEKRTQSFELISIILKRNKLNLVSSHFNRDNKFKIQYSDVPNRQKRSEPERPKREESPADTII
ncbi:hypothetical protein DERP_015455 [Dermatophagoides pteronyssinus]|uniref:Uncharacterized protein n=1 Tax=Dermatophagoides pteronyssinus TaxID=6956 RepID=A0ABQ8JX15_DERPT|nr:hypothetical protein DERP_015455 [Dermatophagoides pteronyssinus]